MMAQSLLTAASTTITAAATAAAEATTITTTGLTRDYNESIRHPTLLREWVHSNVVPQADSAAAAVAAAVPPPLETPAVRVLNDEEPAPHWMQSRVYSYLPVATYVTNFVKTTVDQIADHIHDYTNAEGGACSGGNAPSSPLSFSTIPTTEQQQQMQQQQLQQQQQQQQQVSSCSSIPPLYGELYDHDIHGTSFEAPMTATTSTSSTTMTETFDVSRPQPIQTASWESLAVAEEELSPSHQYDYDECRDRDRILTGTFSSSEEDFFNGAGEKGTQTNPSRSNPKLRRLRKWIKKCSRRHPNKTQKATAAAAAAPPPTAAATTATGSTTTTLSMFDGANNSICKHLSISTSPKSSSSPKSLSSCNGSRRTSPKSGGSPRRRRKHQKKHKKRRGWRRSDSQSTSSDDEGNSHKKQSSKQQRVSASTTIAANTTNATATDNPTTDDEITVSMDSSFRSVEASFVGNADQLMEDGIITATDPSAVASVEAYIEGDGRNNNNNNQSLLPTSGGGGCNRPLPHAPCKMDQAKTLNMTTLFRASAPESRDDLQPRSQVQKKNLTQSKKNEKADFTSRPLSTATAEDDHIHNDLLKVVLVGSCCEAKSSLAKAIRNSKAGTTTTKSHKTSKRRTSATLKADVHHWNPQTHHHNHHSQVKFSIWDIQGATPPSCNSNDAGVSADFGSHPGVQSLFFSPKSLYLMAWDLAANTIKTRHDTFSSLDRKGQDGEEDSDTDEEENEFFIEEINRQADLALLADVENQVLSWVDCITRRGGRGSFILPVAIIPEDMGTPEIERRCDLMKQMVTTHMERFRSDPNVPKVLFGRHQDHVVRVNLSTGAGIKDLQETMIAITDVRGGRNCFDHVGLPLPPGTTEILKTVRRLKKDHKLVVVEHLMAELHDESVSIQDVTEALHFLSSVGELLYFGTSDDEILSRYIILSRKWFVSALSCILRNDLKRELAETRRFMNMQCIYSSDEFPEKEVIEALVSGSDSNCPLLSATDSKMLWHSMSFMREAADSSLDLLEHATTTLSTVFDFLLHIILRSRVFIPLGISDSIGHPELYFVPSLLHVDPVNLWTYKSSDSWMTTLCHSWLFREGAPSDLMENITVSLLRDLFEFSRKFITIDDLESPKRARSYPLRNNSFKEFMETHDSTTLGQLKIRHLMCWKSSFLVKIGCTFADPEHGELRESVVEIFVSIQDESSDHCVASDAMRASMHRLVVSGKGQVGCHGRKLWKGGYGLCLDSIKSSLASYTNVERQVVCPECLAHSSHRSASTWSWDSVRAPASRGISEVRCIRGHRVDANLICGTCIPCPDPVEDQPTFLHDSSMLAAKPVKLSSVVVVGLWDSERNEVCNVGSGYVADEKLGLIVTAGHILFNMASGRQFGSRYHGLRKAKVVVGVIPDGQKHKDAVFRYFAEIVAYDIQNVDACVVRLTSRLEREMDQTMDYVDQQEIPLDRAAMQRENLCPLKMTSKFELEEAVRIYGFNQGGEGVLPRGHHVNLSADVAKGYICKQFRASVHHPHLHHSDENSFSSLINSMSSFTPREEIVIMCPTIGGHSGGPCVNNDGKVVGILSRADPVDRQRCYLVPSSELRSLVKQARQRLTFSNVNLADWLTTSSG